MGFHTELKDDRITLLDLLAHGAEFGRLEMNLININNSFW